MPLRGRLAGLALCLLAGASASALAQEVNTAAGSPEVTVLESDGGDAFVDAVKAHASPRAEPCWTGWPASNLT